LAAACSDFSGQVIVLAVGLYRGATGIDDSQVDNADITFYVGHGTLRSSPSPAPTICFTPMPRTPGETAIRMDVLPFLRRAAVFRSRRRGLGPLGPQLQRSAHPDGFSSLAYAGTGFPAGFALNMLGFVFIPHIPS